MSSYKVLIEMEATSERDMKEQLEKIGSPEIEWWCRV